MSEAKKFTVQLSQAKRDYFTASVQARSKREAIKMVKRMVEEDPDLWCDTKIFKVRIEGIEESP